MAVMEYGFLDELHRDPAQGAEVTCTGGVALVREHGRAVNEPASISGARLRGHARFSQRWASQADAERRMAEQRQRQRPVYSSSESARYMMPPASAGQFTIGPIGRPPKGTD